MRLDFEDIVVKFSYPWQ